MISITIRRWMMPAPANDRAESSRKDGGSDNKRNDGTSEAAAEKFAVKRTHVPGSTGLTAPVLWRRKAR